MKHTLIKKISKIHAIKCNKATIMDESIESFDKLNELKGEVIECNNDDCWDEIQANINDWAGSNPVATEREINDLMWN